METASDAALRHASQHLRWSKKKFTTLGSSQTLCNNERQRSSQNLMGSLWKQSRACKTLTKIIFIRNPFSKTSICVGVVFSRKEGCQEAPVTLVSTGNILAVPSTAPTPALQVLWYPGPPQMPLKAQCARAQTHLSHP